MGLFKRKKKNAAEEAAKKALKRFEEGLVSIQDIIAPAAMEIRNDRLLLNNKLVRSFFVLTYPQYVETNWLSPIINYDVNLDVSMHIYPVDSAEIMRTLRRKVAEMESSIRIEQEKGAVRDPELVGPRDLGIFLVAVELGDKGRRHTGVDDHPFKDLHAQVNEPSIGHCSTPYLGAQLRDLL